MIKYLTSLDTAWGERSAVLVEAHSRGIDHNWLMQKTAGEQREWLRNVDPAQYPDHELIHLLAVGDDEAYGINRNGDAFSADDNARVHDRFVKHAKLFRNHKNKVGKDPDFGYPVASYYNPDMSRIELVVAAHKKTAGDIIHEVASGKDAGFSMGANLYNDVCKICGNKARTAKQHCEHGRKPMLGRVLADGRVCGLDNPDPHYMDISKVGRPAERTAYGVKLLKAAGAGCVLDDEEDVINGAERAEMLGIVLPEGYHRCDIPLQKWAAMQVLAEMEKHVPALGQSLGDMLPAELPDAAEAALREEILKPGGLKRVMEHMHSHGILLRPKQFFRVATGATTTANNIEPVINEIGSSLSDVFTRGVNEGGSDFAEDGRFDGGDCSPVSARCADALTRSESDSSLDDHNVNRRVMRSAMNHPGKSHGVALAKRASDVQPGIAAMGYADLYAAYQLAFVSHSHNHRSTLVKQAVALVNAQEPQR